MTPLPVPIAANGGGIDPRPGVLLTHDRIPADEVVLVHGMRCAIAERALFDEIRRLRRFEDQVVAADMAFGGELTSIRRMRRYRWARYWYRDVRRLDRVLPYASEHARSRPEVDFRLLWVRDVGWADPMVNREVHDLDGGFVGIPDLLDVKRGVAGEFAGGGHRAANQHEDDLGRADRFHGVGLQIVEVVRRDLADVAPCSAADDSGSRASRPPAPALAAGSAHREPRQPARPTRSSRSGYWLTQRTCGSQYPHLDGNQREPHHSRRAALAASSDIGPWSRRSSRR